MSQKLSTHNSKHWLSFLYNAQWEFGRPTLTPTYLEDKTEVKVD